MSTDGTGDASAPDDHALVFEDVFDRASLDPGKWCPFYLPHWSDPETSRPSYRIRDGVLRLYVAEDQPPWCPEFNGSVKVSNLQTGHHSGPLGSTVGQHRFRDGLAVRTELAPCRLFVPHHCRLEVRARTRLGPDNLAALWLIGFEDTPERSGEITLMEVFGHHAYVDRAVVGVGVKRINDPRLVDDFHEREVPIDLADWHTYALDWDEHGVRFSIDGAEVLITRQSPDYPMQLMLNLYDLSGNSPAGVDAAWLDIDVVRAYARTRSRA